MKKRILLKYLLSYFLIFIVPLASLTVVMFNNAIKSLQKEVEASNINKVRQVRDIFDQKRKELDRIAFRIAYNKKITPFMTSYNEYCAQELIDELDKLITNSSFIEELFFYFRDDTRIYCTQGMMSVDAMTRYVYINKNWGNKNFALDLNDVQTTQVRPAEDIIVRGLKMKRLTFMYPIARNGMPPHGTALFIVSEESLSSTVNNLLGDFACIILVLDNAGNVMVSANNGMPELDQSFSDLIIKNFICGVHNISYAGIDYSLASTRSDLTGWTFHIIMPTAQFWENVIHVQAITLQTIAMLLLFGLGTVIFFSLMSYIPIRNLARIAVEHTMNLNNRTFTVEIDNIKATIFANAEYNRQLRTILDVGTPLARNQFFQELLKGRIDNPEMIKKSMEALNINFKGRYFYVMILSHPVFLHHIPSSNNRHEHNIPFLSILSKFSFDDCFGYGIELIDNSNYAIIINMESFEDVQRKQYYIADKVRMVFKNFNIIPTIGVGTLYNDLTEICKSYNEAYYALEYELKRGMGSIIFYEDVCFLKENSLSYPIQGIQQLVRSLKQGDVETATKSLDDVFNYINKQTYSLSLLKSICFDIVNTVLKIAYEIRYTNIEDKIDSLLGFKSLESLKDMLIEVIKDICTYICSMRKFNNRQLIDDILVYLEENKLNANLSLESVAEKFNISGSYLSRYFKEQTGENFSKYLWDLRLNEVKHQLVMSDLPVKEIIMNVGYSDVANFIRKFREIEGITPGKYRLLYKIH